MLAERISKVIAWRLRSRHLGVQIALIAVLAALLPNNLSNREVVAQQEAPSTTTSARKANITDADYRIEEVRAYLWLDAVGRLSTDDVFRRPAGTLWNTPFGSDGAPSSRATLVVVEVTGPPDGAAPRRRLEFSATARLRDGSRRLVLRQSVSIAWLDTQGKYYAPFLLHDTGCVPIELHVEIRGQRGKVSVNRVLDFRCGE